MNKLLLIAPHGSLLEWLEAEKASAFEDFLVCPNYDRDASRWLSRHETMKDVINYIKENTEDEGA